ncbi:MAG TPA: NADH-quinone oxidoreductase subunit J [Bryobacteraceae bacterium]
MTAAFYIAAAVAILATIIALTRLNTVHALLYLVVSLLAVAVVFYTLGAVFVAALEVIVYAGAIMVLFIFVVMLLNLGKRAEEMERLLLSPGMWIGPAALAAVLIAELADLLVHGRLPGVEPAMVGPKQVGIALFGPYLIGVELASILLLGGLIGAYHLGWRKPEEIESKPEIQRKEVRDDSHRARVAASGDLVRVGTDRTSDQA